MELVMVCAIVGIPLLVIGLIALYKERQEDK